MNLLNVPIYEKNFDGTIKPNYIFHRPHNRIHSRCIEYPWCAANYNGELNILDVGSAKADVYWIKWFEGLDANVYLADYDVIEYKSDKLKKVQCDIRRTNFEDDYFDVVFAVSVLEHIGLADPQVKNTDKPEVDDLGDLRAFQELIRVLKPGGKLFLTVPFSKDYKLIMQEQARCYSQSTINRYNLPNVRRTNLDIYQYVPTHKSMIAYYNDMIEESNEYLCELPGNYQWKRINNIIECTPLFKWCVDCVALASYVKLSDSSEEKEYYNNYLIACNRIINMELVKFNNKYMLYGTGGYSSLITQFVRNLGGDVTCYSDTDPRKWGLEYLGKPIIPPNKIHDLRNEFYKIIIASSYTKEILRYLETLGFKLDEDILIYPISDIQDILNDNNFEDIEQKRNK